MWSCIGRVPAHQYLRAVAGHLALRHGLARRTHQEILGSSVKLVVAVPDWAPVAVTL